MTTENEFWNTRYRNSEYVYGTAPNKYFQQQIMNNPAGKILCLCEGEGRNAVFAAENGWTVVATDFSNAGKAKAMKLAAERKADLEYHVCDILDFPFGIETFRYVALIFCHFTPEVRDKVFDKIKDALVPGGAVIFECFSTEQFGRKSGGPAELEKLYTAEWIRNKLEGYNFLELEQMENDMDEGHFHTGMANVIRFIAFKPEA